MGQLDPSVPQVDDPELEANLIRALSVIGQIGKLRVLDVVLPTISMGNVVTQAVDLQMPSYRSTDVFGGDTVAPAAGTVLADTTALPAGTYDVEILVASNGTTGFAEAIALEHRNAANSANLATWPYLLIEGNATAGSFNWRHAFGYELGLNERIRLVKSGASTAGKSYVGLIFARIRS